jgi:thiamine transport system permease protein
VVFGGGLLRVTCAGIILGSLFQATVSTVASLLIALPAAHFFYCYRFPGKSVLLAGAALLCIMPTKLIVFSIAQTGGFGGFTGIVLAHMVLNVPFSFLVLNLAYQKLDATLLWVACDLGANAWQVYTGVIFPFLRGTIVSMGLLLFLLHLTSFSIPLALGTAWYHQTPDMVISELYTAGKVGYAWLWWGVRVLVCLPLIVVLGKYDNHSPAPDHRVCQLRCDVYRPRQHGWWWLAYGCILALLTVVPLCTVFMACCSSSVVNFLGRAVQGYVDPVLTVSVPMIIRNSVVLALVSGVCAVMFACLVDVCRRLAGDSWLNTMVTMLTIVPFLVGSVGIGMLCAGASDCRLMPAWAAALTCHVFLNYPFAYRIISAQLDRVHEDVKKSAQSLGATPFQAFATVLLPYARPALISAFCVAYGLSLTEVGTGAVLANHQGTTLPMAIRACRAAGNQNATLGLSLILMLLTVVMSLVLSRWTRQRT